MTHHLKTWPEYFEAVKSGAKTFELRSTADRTFAVGDLLVLQEYCPETDQIAYVGYTGRDVRRIVTYILPGGSFGLEAGYCVLALGAVSEEKGTD